MPGAGARRRACTAPAHYSNDSLNGTSSSRFHEQSTTARPLERMRGPSAADTLQVPAPILPMGMLGVWGVGGGQGGGGWERRQAEGGDRSRRGGGEGGGWEA